MKRAGSDWLGKLKKGLQKTRENLAGQLNSLVLRHKKIDELFWEDLEDTLIQADLGVAATEIITERIRQHAAAERLGEPEQVIDALKTELREALAPKQGVSSSAEPTEATFLIVGVNGTGKTTTIAKLAHRYKRLNKSVLLAAADTFRAAGIEQLVEWGRRLAVDTVKHERGSDPAAVVFDAVQAAKSRGIDILIIDTAGRLHTYVNLMEELKKVKRITTRESGDREVRTLLVIDATTGQNGVAQARIFHEALDVDGIVLTKMDGTAKGGIVVSIQDQLGIPVEYIGVGESLEDFHRFEADAFVEALISE